MPCYFLTLCSSRQSCYHLHPDPIQGLLRVYRTNGSIWITVQSSSLLSHRQNCCAKYRDGHSGLLAAELPLLPAVCCATNVSRCLSLGYSAHYSLLFIPHHKPNIKGCGKIPLSSCNQCSLGFGAGKRRQHAKHLDVIFLFLWWDTVCLILVYWKLYTLSKLLIWGPSTVKDNAEMPLDRNSSPLPWPHRRMELIASRGCFFIIKKP